LKAANELEHILNYLEAIHKIDMQRIAENMEYSYEYLRGEKVKKKPSQKLIDMITIRYKPELKDLPQYEAGSYARGKENDQEYILNEDPEKFGTKQTYLKEWMAEKEARLRDAEQRATIAEAEKDRLLNILENLAPDKINQANPPQQNDATSNSDGQKDKN